MNPFYQLFNCACGCGKCDDKKPDAPEKLVNDEDGLALPDDDMENGAYRGALSAIRNSQPCGDSHIPDGHQCHAGQGENASRDESTRQSDERSQSQKAEERYIATTILDQIRATDRMALGAWGTRNLTIMPAGKVGEDGYQRGGVQFKVNGGKLGHGIVKVRLMGNDTYTVETGKVRLGEWKEKGRKSDIYAEDLMRTIDHMVERDVPGYSNGYKEALEAMRNSGTSDGAKKGWETRRGEAEAASHEAEKAESGLQAHGEKHRVEEIDRLNVAQKHDAAGRKWIDLAAQLKARDRDTAIKFWQKGNSHFRRAGGETVSFSELSNAKCGASWISDDKVCRINTEAASANAEQNAFDKKVAESDLSKLSDSEFDALAAKRKEIYSRSYNAETAGRAAAGAAFREHGKAVKWLERLEKSKGDKSNPKFAAKIDAAKKDISRIFAGFSMGSSKLGQGLSKREIGGKTRWIDPFSYEKSIRDTQKRLGSDRATAEREVHKLMDIEDERMDREIRREKGE